MKLKYRGVEYNHTPLETERAGVEVIGKYRGAVCQRSRLATIPVHQPVCHLKYRGCTYTTGTSAQQTSVVPQPTVPATSQLSPSFGDSLTAAVTSSTKMSVHKLLEVNEVHQRFIHESLRHRLAVAKQRGDRNLIDLLEREQQQVA